MYWLRRYGLAMKTIILTDECTEELFLLGWHHPNQRRAAGMDICGDEANHVQQERHGSQDTQPSNQGIVTIA